jgi:hypothetical protein
MIGPTTDSLRRDLSIRSVIRSTIEASMMYSGERQFIMLDVIVNANYTLRKRETDYVVVINSKG